MSSSGVPIASDLSPDRPGVDPSSDRLGYAPFAKRLAQSIGALSRAEGHVVALHGRWGFGKSTMLNYVRYYLNEIEPDRRPIIVSYNPWWFSGHDDLIRAFFGQLRATIEGQKEFSPEVRTRLANFADALSDVPLPYFNLGKLASKVLRPELKDIAKLKMEISTALRDQPRRILVIIDDIDRLTSEEIRQVFRVVKSVGDFPNITYLMAFDKKVVTQSLEQIQGSSGEDYLEKIVQVPLELPLVDRLSIRALFFEQLDSILAGIEPKSFDQTYWANVFLEGIDKFLETPRDVIRFTNSISVTLRAVIGEVNPVDFIAIESLRIFCPEIYEEIRNNREMFSGHAHGNLRDAQRDELAQFHNSWLRLIHESRPRLEEPIKDLVRRLFPKVQEVWGNTQFGPEWEAEWRRKTRICSDAIFPIYFSLTVPTGEISNSEMEFILAKAGSTEQFGAEILRMAEQTRPDGKTRADALLVRLQDYTDAEISIGQIEPIVITLLDIGDRLMRPDASTGMFDFGIDTQCVRVIWQLLKRLDRPRPFEILKRAFDQGHALGLIEKSLIVLGQQQGLYGEHIHPEQEWFVTREQLTELDAIFTAKMHQAAHDGSLLHAPRSLVLLSFWAEKGGQTEAQAWVASIVREEHALAEFLERNLQSSSSFSLGDPVGRKRDRLDPNWFQTYVDVEQLVGRVQELSGSESLTERQKRAVDQFLKESEIRGRGENPDDPFARHQLE